MLKRVVLQRTVTVALNHLVTIQRHSTQVNVVFLNKPGRIEILGLLLVMALLLWRLDQWTRCQHPKQHEVRCRVGATSPGAVPLL